MDSPRGGAGPPPGDDRRGRYAAQAAAVRCSVDYTVNDWGSGFSTELTVTNRSSAAIDGWTLTYDYAGSQKLANGWNGTWSQSGSTVTVRNASWNGAIAAGSAVTTGAQFTYSGTNTAPTTFAVNGTECVGAHQPPITVLTSPAAGAVFSAGDAVPLAATAAAADGAGISKVEFYDDTKLLGTDTTSPYTYSAEGLTAGGHSVYARAYDSLGASAESTPAGITVVAGPAVVATPAQLGVQQGKSGTFTVSLSTEPASSVTATVARSAGNSGLSVTGGASLTFTPANWSTPQQVTVSADATGTGAATFTVTAPGHGKSEVTVTQLAEAKDYDARFLDLYGKITDPANGYFSSEGIPYHSVETLIVEAPDHGHETTSEAYSYLIWLQAMYGKITGDWAKFNGAWDTMETYMIPTHADQPTNSFYDASKPATYAPEHDTPNEYPAVLDGSAASGSDPIASELKSAYGTDDIYGMHWIQDVDNVYGYGNTPGSARPGPPGPGRRTSTPSSAAPRSPSGRPSPTPPATTSPTAGPTATWTCSPGTPPTPSSGSSPTHRTRTPVPYRPPTGPTSGRRSRASRARCRRPSARPPRWATTSATPCSTSTSRRSATASARPPAPPAAARTARTT